MSKSFTKSKRKLILSEKLKSISEPTKKQKKEKKEEDENIINLSEFNLSKSINMDNSLSEKERKRKLLSFHKIYELGKEQLKNIKINLDEETINKLKDEKIIEETINILSESIYYCDTDELFIFPFLLLLSKLKKIEDFCDEFKTFIYRLNKENRIKFQNLIIKSKKISNEEKISLKKYFKNKDMKTLYLELINEIRDLYYKDKLNEEEIKKLNESEKYNIPLLEVSFPVFLKGNMELKYCYLINSIFILFQNIPIPNDIKNENEKVKIKNKIFKQIAYRFMNFFSNILINENEFNQRFKDNQEIIYFHFLYIHIILFSSFDYNFDEGISNYISICFETEKEKLYAINKFLECNKQKKIKQIKSFITIKIKNDKIIFNPFEYNCKKLFEECYIGINNIKMKLNEQKYFSLMKFYNKRQFGNDIELFEEMKKSYKMILTSNTYNELINKMNFMKEIENPFLSENGEEILKEFENLTFFIPIPSYKIHGLTDKFLGLIFININIKLNQNKKNIELYLNYSNQEWTLIHEYGFHCLLLLYFTNFHDNNDFCSLKSYHTPLIVFDDDYISSDNDKVKNNLFDNILYYFTYDLGEKGETYIFGEKFSLLYFIGALNLFEEKRWKVSLSKHRDEFQEYNKDLNIDNKKFKLSLYKSSFTKLFFQKYSINKELKDKVNVSSIFLQFRQSKEQIRVSSIFINFESITGISYKYNKKNINEEN